MLEDLLPRTDARDRRVHQHKLRHLLRILRNEGIAHHVANIVGDNIGLFDLQRLQHAGDILALRLLVIAFRRLGGETHAAQVRHDDRVITDKVGRKRLPHVAGLAITMQQHHSRPLAADADMQRPCHWWRSPAW